MNKIIEEIDRELAMRFKVYGNRIRTGTMTTNEADKFNSRLRRARQLVKMVEEFIEKSKGLTGPQDAWIAGQYAKMFQQHIDMTE